MNFRAAESLAEQIAQHLGQRIICGQLKPEERIQELKIAGELDVSRGSVREALLILERRHLINIFPRKGAVVSELTAHHVSSLYDIYMSLLTMLAQKLADCLQPGDMALFLAQVEKISKLTRTVDRPIEEVIDAAFELMSLCYPLVDNPYLEETLENFRPALSRTYFIAMNRRRGERDHSLAFVSKLVEAVQGRDYEGIANVIHVYGSSQRDLVLKELEG
ncbi:MAG: GntR family transcriptional regulator [Hahellaceae bacterium]|nr:GntR family transcriptional regulator [Hahellaceae bacterium]